MRSVVAFIFLTLITSGIFAENKPAESKSVESKKVSVDHAGFEQLKKTQPELQILDVRTESEFKEGYIAGAINIDHKNIEAIRATIAKDKPIILYCRSGRRAGIVADALLASGYKQVYHLDGDMKGWLAAEKPVVKTP